MLTDEEKEWEEINKMDTIVPGEQYVAVDRAILSTFANYWNFPELKSLLKGSTSDSVKITIMFTPSVLSDCQHFTFQRKFATLRRDSPAWVWGMGETLTAHMQLGHEAGGAARREHIQSLML